MKKRPPFRIVPMAILLSLSFCAGLVMLKAFSRLLETQSNIGIRRDPQFGTHLQFILFVTLIALLPLVIWLLWRFTPVYTARRRVWSILILVLCLAVSLAIRYQQIVAMAERDAFFILPYPGINPSSRWVVWDELHLWICPAAAILVSGIFIYMALRENIPEKKRFSFEDD